jgi:hypothetical protein
METFNFRTNQLLVIGWSIQNLFSPVRSFVRKSNGLVIRCLRPYILVLFKYQTILVFRSHLYYSSIYNIQVCEIARRDCKQTNLFFNNFFANREKCALSSKPFCRVSKIDHFLSSKSGMKKRTLLLLSGGSWIELWVHQSIYRVFHKESGVSGVKLMGIKIPYSVILDCSNLCALSLELPYHYLLWIMQANFNFPSQQDLLKKGFNMVLLKCFLKKIWR